MWRGCRYRRGKPRGGGGPFEAGGEGGRGPAVPPSPPLPVRGGLRERTPPPTLSSRTLARFHSPGLSPHSPLARLPPRLPIGRRYQRPRPLYFFCQHSPAPSLPPLFSRDSPLSRDLGGAAARGLCVRWRRRRQEAAGPGADPPTPPSPATPPLQPFSSPFLHHSPPLSRYRQGRAGTERGGGGGGVLPNHGSVALKGGEGGPAPSCGARPSPSRPPQRPPVI